MSRIRVLDAGVVDRIAAGEVVERPASVVKELVENALDAGARRVAVRVDAGGTRRIEVEDDGHGMDAEDARLAFRQHATSKISSAADLERIGSLGFRGEALPSIASVSRVELTTGTGDGPGTRLRLEGGEPVSEARVAWPRGTTVVVEDLFFNTPARRKHLKTRSTEFGHIAAAVQDYALADPELHVTLEHGSRQNLAAPPVETLRERVHQVLGSEVAGAWLPVDYGVEGLRIGGGVAGPGVARPDRRGIHLFVNLRPVSDGRLAHAVTRAYESVLESGRYPVAVLFLEVPPDDVDVNVHPRKVEVRFVNHGRVYGALLSAVRRALAEHLPPGSIAARPSGSREAGRDGEAATASGGEAVRIGGEARHAALPLADWVVLEGTRGGSGEAGGVGDAGAVSEAPTVSARQAEVGSEAGVPGTRGPIQPLAQYANTYILAADEDGLLIIDQHVAHERILYEQVLDRLEERGLEVQQLLVPEMVELVADEAEVAADRAEVLGELGFEVEHFGGDTWAVRSAPALLEGRGIEGALRSLLGSLAEERGDEAVEEARKRAAASIACHAAVRANQPLSREVMAHLVGELGRCELGTRCPHGRPVLLRIDHPDLEKGFGRR